MRSSGAPQLSGLLRDMAMRAKGEIALSELLNAFGERSFGAAILLLAAPNIIPLPPGSSAVFGLPLVFITAQLMLGWKVIGLPHKILSYRLKASTFWKCFDSIFPSSTGKARGTDCAGRQASPA